MSDWVGRADYFESRQPLESAIDKLLDEEGLHCSQTRLPDMLPLLPYLDKLAASLTWISMCFSLPLSTLSVYIVVSSVWPMLARTSSLQAEYVSIIAVCCVSYVCRSGYVPYIIFCTNSTAYPPDHKRKHRNVWQWLDGEAGEVQFYPCENMMELTMSVAHNCRISLTRHWKNLWIAAQPCGLFYSACFIFFPLCNLAWLILKSMKSCQWYHVKCLTGIITERIRA